MIGLLLKERNDAVKLEEDPEQVRLDEAVE